MVHLKLANLFVGKQVMLSATLPDIESEILCCKDILFANNNLVASSRHRTHHKHELWI